MLKGLYHYTLSHGLVNFMATVNSSTQCGEREWEFCVLAQTAKLPKRELYCHSTCHVSGEDTLTGHLLEASAILQAPLLSWV